MRVGLIGFGGIGQTVARLAAQDPAIEIAAILVRRVPADPMGHRFVTEPDALRAAGCDLVAECAGHAALRQNIPALLAGGTDCVIAAVGALADPQTEQAVRDAAARGGARLTIPAGAVGGLDLLAAARLGGLDSVRYQSRKNPAAWRGTPAEHLIDLASLTGPATFFHGTARQAALDYPQNANVAATVAFGGIGLDATEVDLIADPGTAENRHSIELHGAFGTARIEIAGRTLPGSPRTSYLAALSMMRAISNAAARIVV